MPGCLFVDFCGYFAVEIETSNSNSKRHPKYWKKVGVERVKLLAMFSIISLIDGDCSYYFIENLK